MSSRKTETVHLMLDAATALGARALRSIGYSHLQAEIVAANLVDAEACGFGYAGLGRIISISAEKQRWPNPGAITVTRETPVSALLDGASNIGYLVGVQAADIAARKARENGVAVVGAHNTYFSGRNAYYAERIARQGLVVIHCTSAFPAVVPPGGMRAVLGTNPISIAIPNDPHPFVWDITTAAITHSEIERSCRLGHTLPDGVAVDASGSPTTSAVAALAGGIVPFGGHRGYGLSIAVQLLGLVAGADMRAGELFNGLFFIVFRPDILRPLGDLKEGVAAFLVDLSQGQGVPDSSIRVPSVRSFAARDESQSAGIFIPAQTHDALLALIDPVHR